MENKMLKNNLKEKISIKLLFPYYKSRVMIKHCKGPILLN